MITVEITTTSICDNDYVNNVLFAERSNNIEMEVTVYRRVIGTITKISVNGGQPTHSFLQTDPVYQCAAVWTLIATKLQQLDEEALTQHQLS